MEMDKGREATSNLALHCIAAAFLDFGFLALHPYYWRIMAWAARGWSDQGNKTFVCIFVFSWDIAECI
jgi:hypothetical protein